MLAVDPRLERARPLGCDRKWKGGQCGFSFVPLCHGARVRNNFSYALLNSRTSGREVCYTYSKLGTNHQSPDLDLLGAYASRDHQTDWPKPPL